MASPALPLEDKALLLTLTITDKAPLPLRETQFASFLDSLWIWPCLLESATNLLARRRPEVKMEKRKMDYPALPLSLCSSPLSSLTPTLLSMPTTRAWERDRREVYRLLRASALPWKKALNSEWSVDNLQLVMDTLLTWTPPVACTSLEETDIKCPSTISTASNCKPKRSEWKNAASLARLMGTKTPRSRQTKRENE